MQSCKWMLVVTKLFNIAVTDYGAEKTACNCCSQVFVVAELVVSMILCSFVHKPTNVGIKQQKGKKIPIHPPPNVKTKTTKLL